MSKNAQATLWALVAALVTAFGQELSLGNVPLQAEWRWVVPLVVAAISAFSPYLKKAPRR